MAEITFRPLDESTWIDDGRAHYLPCLFRASWASTMRELRYELSAIDVRLAVLEIDYDGKDLRRDGLPKAYAKPNGPRVRLSFQTEELGPISFMSDAYAEWKDNVRGIVKTLAAMRAIERYGATRGKQQYKGWASLPETATSGFKGPADALAFLERAAGNVTPGQHKIEELYRMAALRNHPDKGGTQDMMAKIQDARRVLGF